MRLGLTQQLRTEQRLVQSPQMIQAMQVLQLPLLELKDQIDQELQENVFLERKDETQWEIPDLANPEDDLIAMELDHEIRDAIMAAGDEWHVVEPREIGVLDRIGGGDGFVGGMLYAILKGWEPEKWAQFGWATGALVVTLLTDYAQAADEDQIWSIWSGNARVKR